MNTRTFAAFTGTLAENWIRSGEARNQTGTPILGAGFTHGCLTHCIMLASHSAFLVLHTFLHVSMP